MNDWRSILKASPRAQNPQNPQKGIAGGRFEDIEDIEQGVTVSQEAADGPDALPIMEGSRPAKVPPLVASGFLVCYRDVTGRLRGGADEREAGTVQECLGTSIVLTNGERLAASRILAISRVDAEGRILAAWTVRGHGFDGTQEQGSRSGN